jgi:hypothetical protein
MLPAAMLWIAVNLPSVSTMSYDWDAAQYSLGTLEYNLVKHQPHPPGYPLWVLGLRALAPLTGGAPLAQTILGCALTLAALFCFYRLARVWSGARAAVALTLLLGFSPPVQLYAFAQSTYPVDFLASCLLGWLAWRMWQGDVAALRTALPAAAVLMGFRPSGVLMLGPLLAVAAARGFQRQPKALVAPLVAAALVFLAWFWPLQASVGGVGEWAQLNRDLFLSNAGITSLFLGAPGPVVLKIMARLTLILGVALVPLVGLVVPGQARASRPWGFLILWLAPGLLFNYLVHFAKPGYLLLVLPPLFLALGAVRPTRRTVLAGLVAAEVLAVLPYDRLPEHKLTRAIAVCTPHAARTAQRANSALRQQVARLQPAHIRCEDAFRETAPNIRTVAYDFRGQAGPNAPVHLVRQEGAGPAGTRLVYRGNGFELWQP